MTFKDTVKSLLRRPRPMKAADAAEIADWVNEGGSFDPAGPPRVIEDGPVPESGPARRDRGESDQGQSHSGAFEDPAAPTV